MSARHKIVQLLTLIKSKRVLIDQLNLEIEALEEKVDKLKEQDDDNSNV